MRAIPAGILLGIGLGGFADGIARHQIAQWHNMGSAVLPPVTMEAMRRNMTWDGVFHAATWCITLAGVLQLWSQSRRQETPAALHVLIGQMIFGWGAFNLVDHHWLGLLGDNLAPAAA